MALALTVHVLTFLALWMVSPLRPILPNFDNAIDVTIETPAKDQLPAEAKKEEPPPPVELGPAPRQGLPEALQIQPPPRQAEPELQPVPETAAPPLPIPAPRPAPVTQLQASTLPTPEPQPQAPAPPEPARAPEPPTPPLEQIVPLPEAARPPTAMDFPKPAPPRPQAQPLPAPRPAPAPQPRLPTDNQAALKPSPLHSSTDVTAGNAADYYTQMTRRLGQYRYYPKSALDAQQEGRHLGRREGEAHELHRRGLAVVARAFLVFFRHALDGLATDADEGAVLDAAEARQRAGAVHRIVDLEHDGGDQLAALRDQRIIGGEFIGQLPGASLLDEQHFEHLVQHGVERLEVEGCEGADFEAAMLLQLGDAAAALGADLGVFRRGQDIGSRDAFLRHVASPPIHRRGRKVQSGDWRATAWAPCLPPSFP